MRLRYEDFGAIVAIDDPPALIHVDQQLARSLGHPHSPRWDAPRGHLSAPTEVHLLSTNRCDAGCPGCYTQAVPDAAEPTTEALSHALRRMADAGVFHVALGGGEALLRPDLFRLAALARDLGMVPNLTTSGLGLTDALAERCQVFGRVHVSLDGLGETYLRSRGYAGDEVALRALRRLAGAGVACGVNYVLDRRTWDDLDATVRAVANAGGDEMELLRFKPAGRGAAIYEAARLTPEQGLGLWDRLATLAARYPAVDLKIDCSFVPFLCAAEPDPAQLAGLGVSGCEAGHALAAVTASLEAVPCSFIDRSVGDVDALFDGWDDDPALLRWRRYHHDAPQPCRDCPYRAVCKGGCRVVAKHVVGEWFAPDPECPRVVSWRA